MGDNWGSAARPSELRLAAEPFAFAGHPARDRRKSIGGKQCCFRFWRYKRPDLSRIGSNNRRSRTYFTLVLAGIWIRRLIPATPIAVTILVTKRADNNDRRITIWSRGPRGFWKHCLSPRSGDRCRYPAKSTCCHPTCQSSISARSRFIST